MTTTVANVPIHFAPGAAERVDEIALQEELSEVLAWTCNNVPSLHSIDVAIYRDPDEHDGLRLALSVWRDEPYVRRDPVRAKWKSHMLETISMRFRRWFVFDMYPREAVNGR